MFEFSLQNISLILVTVYLIYYLYRRHASYFEQRNVKTPKNFPVFGFMYEIMFKKRHINDVFGEYYNQFSDTRFFGVFEFLKPVYIIRDLDLIRQISIKDFDNFVNHRQVIEASTDRIFGQNLFVLRDQKWRDMRPVLSPAFTGSKMRHMFSLVANISSDYMTEMTRTIKTEEEIEFTVFANKYCHDVIAKCAFGVSVNSYTDPENEYFKAGKHATEFPISLQLKFIGFSVIPWLMNLLKVQIFDSKTRDFFINIVGSNVKYREENDVKINDVINLLMQARKNGAIEVENDKAYESAGFATAMESEGIKQSSIKISKWDFTDITAQCAVFFLAGFDTVSTAVYYMAYSLATNPKVQTKLHQEINDLVSSLNGRLPSYEDIQKLNYLDMVLSETLRMYPPVPTLDRRCNQKTTIENNDGTKVELQPGDVVFFPITSIHRDPNHFPEPEKFIPERFAPENRDNIKPFSYLPFGVGPRNCIGSRFALMEIKSLFFSLLTHFTIEASARTEVPLKVKPDLVFNKPLNGIWVTLKKKNL